MSSLLARNSSPISPSLSTMDNVTIVTIKPKLTRLHAHTEALEDSLSRSRDKRSPPSGPPTSSPQKRTSTFYEMNPGGIETRQKGRRAQRRFSTLPVPIRADSKIETTGKPKDLTVQKDSIWSIPSVKWDKFYKNLLKKPKLKRQSPDKDAKSATSERNTSDKKSPEKRCKAPLVKTFSEPRTAGNSKFYLDNLEHLHEKGIAAMDVDRISNDRQEQVKVKREQFIKTKAKSASLLPRTANGKTEDPPTKIKIRDSQSTSSEDALSPVKSRGMERSRFFRGFEPADHRLEAREYQNESITRISTGISKNHKPRSSDQFFSIQKLEREPRRSSRHGNGGGKERNDNDDNHEDHCNFAGDGAHASDPKRTARPLPSSSKSFPPHNNISNFSSPDDHVTLRKKTDATVNNGTGTGTITSGESCLTTSPVSGERSILSDSGYSVTSNDILLTDTGYVLLDSVGAVNKFHSSLQEGAKNVNAGCIHSPLQSKENQSPPKSSISGSKQKLKEESFDGSRNISELHCNTFPQVKSSRKVIDSFPATEAAVSTSHLPPTDLFANISTQARSGHRSLGFSKEDFETIKQRAKSVEITVHVRSKHKTGKRRACSISKERSLVTLVTRTEETIYPKSRRAALNGRESEDSGGGKTGKSPSPSKDVKFDSNKSGSDEYLRSFKSYMTTDFPFTYEDSKTAVEWNPPTTRKNPGNIVVKISSDQSDLDDSSEISRHVDSQRKTHEFFRNESETRKTLENGKYESENSSGIKMSPRRDPYFVLYENPLYDRQPNRKLQGSGHFDRPKKLPAISYFDGSKWMTSDEGTSEDDQRSRGNQSEGRTVTRCVETQTSEDFPLTVDQFSQTQFTSFHFQDQNASRRDSVRSVIAHEYGEMYSIYREVPPALTFLKASLVSEPKDDSEHSKGSHGQGIMGPWGQRSSVGFGFFVLPTATDHHGARIYDGKVGNDFMSFRLEPIIERFDLLI